MAENESTVSLGAEINIDTSKATSGIDNIGSSIESVVKKISNLSSELDKAVAIIEGMSETFDTAVDKLSKADIKNFSNQVAQLKDSLNSIDIPTPSNSNVKSSGSTNKNNKSDSDARLLEAQNEKERIALEKAKLKSGITKKEMPANERNVDSNARRVPLAEEKQRTGITDTDAINRSKKALIDDIKSATKFTQVRSEEPYAKKVADEKVSKEVSIKATNVTIKSSEIQKDKNADRIASNRAKAGTKDYAQGLKINSIANENNTMAMQIAEKKVEGGIDVQALDVKANNAQVSLNATNGSTTQQKADTSILNSSNDNQNADEYIQELELNIALLKERNKQLDKLNKANALEIEQNKLESGITERDSKTRALEADNRTEKLRQEKELLGGRKATEQAKARFYDARAGRANDDYRYEAGWRGGIASGIGGAMSRARARSGLAGFAARVGTGVGQLNPERNIMKGATISGLGLNPMTLAFSAVGAGIAKLTEGLGKLAVESLQAYGELDKLKTGLSVVFGSDTEANTVFEGIKEYSLESPFGVEQTTEMATLLKQSGVYGTELLDTMKMLGDTAGGNEEKFKRIANNYAQIASVGKASMLDMRQFAYAGIPIYKKVAEELGVSQSVLRQMISDGEVTNEVMEKVFKTMTSEGGEFYQAVERGAETLNARLTNLKDAINIAKGSWGEVLFKADFKEGGNLDNQGVLGKLLTFVENIAQDVTKIATEKNLNRDVENVSAQDKAVQQLSDLIYEANISGADAALLQEVQKSIAGNDFMETQRDVFTRLGDYWQDIEDKANPEYFAKLSSEIASLQKILSHTDGLAKETRDAIDNVIRAKESELLNYQPYTIASVQEKFGITDLSKPPQYLLETQAFQDTDYGKMMKNLEISKPYVEQTRSLELATMLFEQGQKRASASTSLTTIAEQSRQEYYNTEKGKEELLEKERQEYEKNYQKFQDLRGIIDDTGNILDNVDIDIGKFLELMKSGIIEPLEGINTTWSGLAYNINDSYTKSQEKLGKWEGMASRSDDLEKLTKELPENLRLSFEQIFAILEDSDLNSKDNVSRLDSVLTELKANESFNKDEKAMLMLEYLLTGTASVMDKMYSWEEMKGKNADTVPPLWKRITGNALGVDANMITNAKDFYNLYTTQFQGRNISKGVISGMVDSGKSIADITKLLRYTGGKGTIGGVTQNTDTMQIDWVKTAEAMAQFALSAEASVRELEAYGNAIDEQIDSYNALKKSMFTTGEDWDKLDPDELVKQFENAFSGIGASMVATNALGITRGVELNENGEAIFKDTKELVSAQNAYQLSLENTANAVDEAIERLRESAVDVGKVLPLIQTKEGFQKDRVQAELEYTSARYYREGFAFDPTAITETINATINDLMGKDKADLQAAISSQSDSVKNAREEYFNAKSQGYTLPEELARTDADIVRDYSGLESIYSESFEMFDRLAVTIEEAKKVIQDRTGLSDTGLDQELIDAEQFLKSIEALAYSSVAKEVKNQQDGNQFFDPIALAEWGAILAKASNVGTYDEYIKTTIAQLNTEGQKAWGSQLYGVDVYNERKKTVEKNLKNQLGVDANEKLTGSAYQVYLKMLELAESLGVVDVELDELAKTVKKSKEDALNEAARSGDLGAYASTLTQTAVKEYHIAKTAGDKAGVSQAVGSYAGGQALALANNTISGTDIGAFAEGTMQGGPAMGVINMLFKALGDVVGGLEIMSYALNPVTHLLQMLAPIIKILMVPMVAVSHAFEIVGEAVEKFFDSLPFMKAINDWFDELTGAAEDAAQKLEAMNEMLEKTKQSIMEAEEYFLVQNRTANAQWAAQMQGNVVMDTRKVNDMILTPQGNFSTAPDDYIIAMKEPTSLMGSGSGNSNVIVKFTVNNNASDVVEAQAEERTGGDGQKELFVTISKIIAADYASGRNGWDSAYSGRESRMKGRRISR